MEGEKGSEARLGGWTGADRFHPLRWLRTENGEGGEKQRKGDEAGQQKDQPQWSHGGDYHLSKKVRTWSTPR